MVLHRQFLFSLAIAVIAEANPDADFCGAGAIFAQRCSQVLETGHLL